MAERTYSIKQTSELTGLSENTIRYYEKIKLLPRAARKDNGHRVYRDEDIRTIKLITCLKKTGMPLESMQPFLATSAVADPAAEHPELADQLRSHRAAVVNQISSLQEIVEFIDSRLEKGSGLDRPDTPAEEALQVSEESRQRMPKSIVERSYFTPSASTGKSAKKEIRSKRTSAPDLSPTSPPARPGSSPRT